MLEIVPGNYLTVTPYGAWRAVARADDSTERRILLAILREAVPTVTVAEHPTCPYCAGLSFRLHLDALAGKYLAHHPVGLFQLNRPLVGIQQTAEVLLPIGPCFGQGAGGRNGLVAHQHHVVVQAHDNLPNSMPSTTRNSELNTKPLVA